MSQDEVAPMRLRRRFTLACAVAALGLLTPGRSLADPPPAAPATPPAAATTAAPKTLSESLTGMAKAEYEAGRIL
ncbi:MAG: hypothetical protein ABI193_08165, partial [Minicystis sp.]